jgi:hypothetical protein
MCIDGLFAGGVKVAMNCPYCGGEMATVEYPTFGGRQKTLAACDGCELDINGPGQVLDEVCRYDAAHHRPEPEDAA